jgi:hypothetical protein
MSKKKALDLSDIELIRAVDEIMDGKPDIDDVVDHLEARGYIRLPEDPALEAKRIQARKILAKARRAHERAGEFAHEPVHLFEFTEDGVKRDYWRRQGVLTPEEAAQDTLYWHKKSEYDRKQLLKRFQYHTDRLGEEYQKLLPLDIYQDVA